ncbi:MAG: peptide deformylase [Dehalococcoidia bacterium]|nr:peptide deformylase [Dehalococcoidia bacterium]
MAVRPIRTYGDAVLRVKAKRVAKFDGSIQHLIDDMIETMRAAPGVGLAAPQVGISLRVVVIEMPEEEGVITLINPEIIKRFGERDIDEGCLSLPGYIGAIKRSVRVVVKGRDREGKEMRLKADGLLAQAIEHELDHLDGVLYIDHLASPDMLHKLEPVKQPEEVATGIG